MFDGILQDPLGAFDAVAFVTQVAKVEIQSRIGKACFQRAFHFFCGLRVVAFRLRINGLTEVQDDLGLLRLLERDAARAFHDGGQSTSFLCGGTVVGVFEEHLCQMGQRFLTGFRYRVQP